MAIYELGDNSIEALPATTFVDGGIRERADLQRLLMENVDIVSPDTMVIAEEFSQWEDSKRRVDLLALDKNANIVVIELKRGDVGAHMELQAIRYAAMTSTLTFDKATQVFDDYMQSVGRELDAEDELLNFLDWEEPDEDSFAQDARIVLVAEGFSKEITSTVLWLNNRGLDIRCVRIRPFLMEGRTLVDVQQIIPLPETAEYQVQIREKNRAEQVSRTQNRDLTKFDVTVDSVTHERLAKRRAVWHMVNGLISAGIAPKEIESAIPWRGNLFRSVDGELGEDLLREELVAQIVSEGGKRRDPRYFDKAGEMFYVGGRTYALRRMWGKRTKEALDNLVEAFPDKGVSYCESGE